jgi:hypothetical protein
MLIHEDVVHTKNTWLRPSQTEALVDLVINGQGLEVAHVKVVEELYGTHYS